jgi:hypothetical protein
MAQLLRQAHDALAQQVRTIIADVLWRRVV